jgi:hypothetical protein
MVCSRWLISGRVASSSSMGGVTLAARIGSIMSGVRLGGSTSLMTPSAAASSRVGGC